MLQTRSSHQFREETEISKWLHYDGLLLFLDRTYASDHVEVRQFDSSRPKCAEIALMLFMQTGAIFRGVSMRSELVFVLFSTLYCFLLLFIRSEGCFWRKLRSSYLHRALIEIRRTSLRVCFPAVYFVVVANLTCHCEGAYLVSMHFILSLQFFLNLLDSFLA